MDALATILILTAILVALPREPRYHHRSFKPKLLQELMNSSTTVNAKTRR